MLTWTGEAFHPAAKSRFENPSEGPLKMLQLQMRLDPPLRLNEPGAALDGLLRRMGDDETFALDVIDFALYYLPSLIYPYGDAKETAQSLDAILYVGGSVWEVTPILDEQDQGAYRLSRRAVGPVREAIMELTPSTRAHQHLVTAWNKISGRQPDPSGAYREAVRAIEAAAKPVVSPKADRATLGTMLAAMRDAPHRWSTTLGEAEDVRRMLALVWTSQLDRHGTDDESVPFTVSPEQADAAVHLALALVRLFAGGHVRRV